MPTPKLHYGVLFQPATLETWQECFYTTLYVINQSPWVWWLAEGRGREAEPEGEDAGDAGDHAEGADWGGDAGAHPRVRRQRLQLQVSIVMQRLSYHTESVLSNKITGNRINLSFKDSPRKPLRRRHFSVPFLSWLLFTVLSIVTVLLYYVPLRLMNHLILLRVGTQNVQ